MTIRISYSNKGARLDGPSTGSLLTELWVAAGELDWGGAMLCLLRCPAGEDDIDTSSSKILPWMYKCNDNPIHCIGNCSRFGFVLKLIQYAKLRVAFEILRKCFGLG